jgi:hypothetical protein
VYQVEVPRAAGTQQVVDAHLESRVREVAEWSRIEIRREHAAARPDALGEPASHRSRPSTHLKAALPRPYICNRASAGKRPMLLAAAALDVFFPCANWLAPDAPSDDRRERACPIDQSLAAIIEATAIEYRHTPGGGAVCSRVGYG